MPAGLHNDLARQLAEGSKVAEDTLDTRCSRIESALQSDKHDAGRQVQNAKTQALEAVAELSSRLVGPFNALGERLHSDVGRLEEAMKQGFAEERDTREGVTGRLAEELAKYRLGSQKTGVLI